MSPEMLRGYPAEETPIHQYEVSYMLADCESLYEDLLKEAGFRHDGGVGEAGFMCMSSAGDMVSNPSLPFVAETDVWVPLSNGRRLIIYHMNPEFLDEKLGEWVAGYETPERRYWVVFLGKDNYGVLASNVTAAGRIVDAEPARSDFDRLKGMIFETAFIKGYTSG